MAQLIDDLLAFSRLSRQKLTYSQLDLTALARNEIDELSIGSSKRLSIKIKKLSLAMGDRALIQQVYANLISNAIKYSSTRKVPAIEIGSESKNGETVYFVKDNGVGFDMKYVGKLFGVFQRLHSDEEFEGTGVGLALVQRIIHRHGGRVWAEGEVDQGATFYFTLPKNMKNNDE